MQWRSSFLAWAALHAMLCRHAAALPVKRYGADRSSALTFWHTHALSAHACSGCMRAGDYIETALLHLPFVEHQLQRICH
jgi:hypothetical protein